MSHPFLHNSLALRIVLPFVLITPVFWFAGCAMPPMCPQAEPLPDSEVVQTRPSATPREKMIEITLTEWNRWRRQVVRVGRDDTYCVAGGGFPDQPQGCWLTPDDPMPAPSGGGSGTDMPLPKTVAEPAAPAQAPCLCYPDGTGGEATARGYMLARRYWGIVGKTSTYRQLTTDGWARSVVFVSQIMRRADLQNDQLLTGATRAEYVTDMHDHLLRHPTFVLERTPVVPCPGDLICITRGADHFMTSPTEVQASRAPMYCDLIVKTDPVRHEVGSIGGDIQQSASISITELSDVNQLDPYTNSVMQWLVMLCNRLPQQTADVTLFGARHKFINM